MLADLPGDSRVAEATIAAVPPALSLGAAFLAPDPANISGALEAFVGSVGDWLTSVQQKEINARLTDVIRLLIRELERLEKRAKPLRLDEEWSEFFISTLPLVARTRSEQERERFAKLLADGATAERAEQREEGRTMAILLDQLEYGHVALLDRVMAKPRGQDYHGLWGSTREVEIAPGDFDGPDEGAGLLRLEGLGLLRIVDTATRSPDRLNNAIRVNHLGIRFHAWITMEPDTVESQWMLVADKGHRPDGTGLSSAWCSLQQKQGHLTATTFNGLDAGGQRRAFSWCSGADERMESENAKLLQLKVCGKEQLAA
jgi:hypothetical protein